LPVLVLIRWDDRGPAPECRRLSVAADRFAADAGRLLNARQRPAHTPSARISCCLSSSKTLLMPATEPAFRARVNVSAVSVNCRF
jgi:hypothetical protein